MIRRVAPPIVLVIVANVAILLSARANRSGDPDAVITLTEREARIAPASDRDSARRLDLTAVTRLPTVVAPQEAYEVLAWATADKLASLGFDCRPPREMPADSWSGSCGLRRRLFVVLEYDGAASRRVPANINYSKSRLVAVDAGRDAAALRRAYPDRHVYLILPCTMTAWMSVDRRRTPASPPQIRATLQLVTSSLVAPARLRDRMVALGPSPPSTMASPRYTVTIAVGRSYEPWIVAIDPIDSARVPR